MIRPADAESYQERHRQSVERIATLLPECVEGAPDPNCETFVRSFYSNLPLVEFEELDPKAACLLAAESYRFVTEREPGKARVAVHSADPEVKGNHTIIEILTDDMPFLVDSVTMELQRLGFTLEAFYHPILQVRRDSSGKLTDIVTSVEEHGEYLPESYMHIAIQPLPEDVSEAGLKEALKQVLAAVRLSVEDWKLMGAKLTETQKDLHRIPESVPGPEIEEAEAFLHWLGAHFVFLGYIEYDFLSENESNVFEVVEDSELGIFRLENLELKPQGVEGIPPEVRHFLKTPQVVEITKSNRKSIVHRPVHMDYITVKRFDEAGDVTGERRFLGLFTSTVYYQSADNIPIIRRKIQLTLERAGFPRLSHNGKALRSILEFFPRDELFQISADQLFDISLGILSLEGRPGVRLFVRKDRFERFVSCMVFIPRERFVTHLRERIQSILEKAFRGTVAAYYTQVSDSPLARLHVIVKTTPGQVPEVDYESVEAELAEAASVWSDELEEALIEKYGHAHGEKLYRRYRRAFPPAYQNLSSIRHAVFDLENIEEAVRDEALELDLYDAQEKEDEDCFHLKLYNPHRQVSLSHVLPMLENMGLHVIDETPFLIRPEGGCDVWIRDFRLRSDIGGKPDIRKLKERFEKAFTHVWYNRVENDAFNQLVLHAGLPWRQVELLRAYSHFLKQIQFPYSLHYIAGVLAKHPKIARALIRLFQARFHPEKQSRTDARGTLVEIEHALGEVDNLSEDRILRRYADIIQHTLRTNYFQKNAEGNPKEYISFKLNSQKIPEVPLPRPYVEIFVYSSRVVGTHLRGGEVARGGLRWSDRHEDFRTEILGLVKAQVVKNAVIVPVGSKGGFVVKHPPKEGGREAWMEEGIECYKTFLRGLLDLTDNLVEGEIVPPEQVIRHDKDDPYLVVAADKGTATFSDIANSVSAEYNFWLGDAFASGGSAGYDHKKMGITARGAWVSVMRHFREMGIDTQSQDFTAVGIGDMGGDVFGNGMLLSKHIRLVGAFNHLHIFIDPSPDAAKSFEERRRLFEMPRSSWMDYNKDLISEGGGVFERSAKMIPISPQMKKALAIEDDNLPPDELIKALLLAPVDLLWNGGIGTYVKSSDETNEEVGDRANDSLRVNGEQLRCKVVGEGGNLGFTQLGRIEYAKTGGRINTDAIDNSAGVDCSDHEVNIKIALGKAMEASKLSLEQRNELLESMTGTVAELVLRDNEQQTQAITIDEQQGYRLLESHARLMRHLSREGLLNREIEYLPDDEELDDRLADREGLTRPELSVLLAYSKISFYQQVLPSTLPDDAYFTADLIRYFPEAMQEKYREEIESHRLRREIIATVLTNSLINRAGSTFFHRLMEETGVQACDIARAYTICRDAFNLRELWSDIEALDGKIDVSLQVRMFTRIHRFMHRVTLWFLRNCPQPLNVSQQIEEYAPGIAEIAGGLEDVMADQTRKLYDEAAGELLEHGVPDELARRIAGLDPLTSACNIVKVAAGSELTVNIAAGMYFQIGARLQLGWLRDRASHITIDSYWDQQAVNSVIDDLFDQQRRLTASIVAYACQQGVCELRMVDKWLKRHELDVERYDQFLDDLKTHEHLDLAMLTVALRKIESIAGVETLD